MIHASMWGTDAFVAWFDDYVTSDDATTKVRRVARGYGIVDLIDDLRSEWYVRVRATMTNKQGRGEPAGDFADESAARGYVYQALKSVAQDLLTGRIRSDGEMPPDLAVEPPDLVIVWVIDQIRIDLLRIWRTNPMGRHGCTGARCVPTALAAVEVCIGACPSDDSPPERVGGQSEWQAIISYAMELLWPHLRPNGDAKHDQACRQMKSRCGKCAHEVLIEQFTDKGYGNGGQVDG